MEELAQIIAELQKGRIKDMPSIEKFVVDARLSKL